MKYNNPNGSRYYNEGYDKKSQKALQGCLFGIAVALVLAVLIGVLTSCQSIKYVPVETVKTEYVSKTDTFIQRDSIHEKDSILVFIKGDSVFTDRWHILYKDRLKEVLRTDTVIKTDSVQVPYPVEKPLTRWQKMKMDIGGILMALCAVLLLIFVGYILLFRKR